MERRMPLQKAGAKRRSLMERRMPLQKARSEAEGHMRPVTASA